MGNVDRARKKTQLWKKALIHFSFCFAMGFFTGFAPTGTASFFSDRHPREPYHPIRKVGIIPNPIQALHKPADPDAPHRAALADPDPTNPNPNLPERGGEGEEEDDDDDYFDDDSAEANPRGLLIAVTTTLAGDRFGPAGLTRLAHTLRLVPPPLLWIVVEAHGEAPPRTAEMLRGTGIMYRHLTFRENFTDPAAEAHHQRNVALGHLEHHRIAGVVHFASADNVYDLQFFEEIRRIEAFGTWPVATMSANEEKVSVEGPICSSSKVVGWFSGDLNDDTATTVTLPTETDVTNGVSNGSSAKPLGINISGFAFNSSILWDPERWGRPTSLPDTSQDSIKFVQEVILEDEAKLKGVPSDCSQIMLWHLHIPSFTTTPLPFGQSQSRPRFMDK